MLSFCAAATLAVPTLIASTASSASADFSCIRTFDWNGDQAQIDNCPDNGAQGWVWLYKGSSDSTTTVIEVQLIDSTYDTWAVAYQGLSANASYWNGGGVWQVQIVEYDQNGNALAWSGWMG